MWYKKNHAQRTAPSPNLKGKGRTPQARPYAPRLSISTVFRLPEARLQVRGSRPPTKTWPLLPAQLHLSRQEHHPVCSSSVCSGGAHPARKLQEIQSSHPAVGHPGPRALQARNAKSALGRPAIGDYPPVLSFHLLGENSPIGPPFVFPHQDWLLVHFLHIFAAKNRSTEVLLVRPPRCFQPLRHRLDGRLSRKRGVGQAIDRGQLQETKHPARSTHPACRSRHIDEVQTGSSFTRRSGCHETA